MKPYEIFSQPRLDTAIEKTSRGLLSTLDVQLLGFCNAACLKCDTPYHGIHPNRHKIDLATIQSFIETGSLDSIAICGKGESTARRNLDDLKFILNVAHKQKIPVHAFYNALELDNEILDHIQNGTFHIMAQFNSLDPAKVETQMGLDRAHPRKSLKISNITPCNTNAGELARQQLRNLHTLAEIARTQTGETTNIGLSIVPESYNIGEMESMLAFAIDNKMSVLVGGLEQAGRATGDRYDELAISPLETLCVRNLMAERDIPASAPTCPYIFSSIHLDSYNRVNADMATGSSCTWFNLLDNNYAKKIHFGKSHEKSFSEFNDDIMNHRISVLPNLKRMASETEDTHVIGGCGGRKPEVLRILAETTEAASTHTERVCEKT